MDVSIMCASHSRFPFPFTRLWRLALLLPKKLFEQCPHSKKRMKKPVVKLPSGGIRFKRLLWNQPGTWGSSTLLTASSRHGCVRLPVTWGVFDGTENWTTDVSAVSSILKCCNGSVPFSDQKRMQTTVKITLWLGRRYDDFNTFNDTKYFIGCGRRESCPRRLREKDSRCRPQRSRNYGVERSAAAATTAATSAYSTTSTNLRTPVIQLNNFCNFWDDFVMLLKLCRWVVSILLLQKA